MHLTHGSLFTGIGGFDLAAQWCGIRTLWQVEQDRYCNRVLEKRFPGAKRYKEIKDVGKEELEKVSIISGGFPCQPFSLAGKRRGKSDDRFLWPEMLRIIKELRPSYVIGENVPGIINMALDQVLSDLESENYTTETFSLTATSLNAWHKRERIWIIAYPDDTENRTNRNREKGTEKGEDLSQFEFSGHSSVISDPKSQRRKDRATGQQEFSSQGKKKIPGRDDTGRDVANTNSNGWKKYKRVQEAGADDKKRREKCAALYGTCRVCTETGQLPANQAGNIINSCIIGSKTELSEQEQREKRNTGERVNQNNQPAWWSSEGYWSAEPGMGRVADGVSCRVDRLRCLGNAIVPQVAIEIFKAIIELEKTKKYETTTQARQQQ